VTLLAPAVRLIVGIITRKILDADDYFVERKSSAVFHSESMRRERIKARPRIVTYALKRCVSASCRLKLVTRPRSVFIRSFASSGNLHTVVGEREREREREISQRELIRKDKTGNSLGIFGKSSGKVRCSLRSPIGDCRKQTIIDGCSDVRDMREK